MRSNMYPQNLFVYSSYWGIWSRVLQFLDARRTPIRQQVEVDLAPQAHHRWINVARINIRAHVTARHASDVYEGDLPEHTLEAMRANLPEDLVQRLLYEDFLSKIDWDKYRAKCNGGASFFDISK